MRGGMLRFGVVAAVLVFSGALLAGQGRTSAHEALQHTCGLTDRQFLSNYQMELEAVGVFGSDYLNGDAKATDVVSAAKDAASVVRSSVPFDPSLKIVRMYAPAMFLAYAQAVQSRAEGEDAGRQMYLAYSVGQKVQDTLRAAEPGLSKAGCDVADLLQ